MAVVLSLVVPDQDLYSVAAILGNADEVTDLAPRAFRPWLEGGAIPVGQVRNLEDLGQLLGPLLELLHLGGQDDAASRLIDRTGYLNKKPVPFRNQWAVDLWKEDGE